MKPRHDWKSGETHRTETQTFRGCGICGLVKITHHEGDGLPWITYERDGVQIVGDAGTRTPPCIERKTK